jgi:hypothetical protein
MTGQLDGESIVKSSKFDFDPITHTYSVPEDFFPPDVP